MKRISTISLILAISLSGISAMAECISPDRVWDVKLDLFNNWKHGIRFIPDGTYESSGNIYTKISMTECFEYAKTDNKILSLGDGDRDVYFYLREENGIVYMLPTEGWTGYESTADDSTSETDKTELQLFDFNAQPGDSYISVRTSGFMALKQNYGYKTLFPAEIHVNSTDNVVIGNKTLRRQYIDKITDPATGKSISFNADSMIQVIETIGIVNSGYPMAFVANVFGHAVPENVNLAQCMNQDREVLWKNENINLPELTKVRPVGKETSSEYHTFLDDSTHLLWAAYGTDSEQETIDIKFHNFRKWQRNGDNVNILDPAVSSPEQFAYKLVNKGRKTDLRVTGNDRTFSDYPLYDFTKDRTEEFQSVMAEIEYIGDMPVLNSFIPIICKIDSVDFYDWNPNWDENEYVKCQHISEIYIPSTGETIRKEDNKPDLFTVLEGVGNVDYPLVYVHNGDNVKLNKIRHSQGQLILLGDNLNVPDIDHKPVKLIRPDREWEYVSYHPFGETTTYRRMKFDGTENHNGRTYHRWETFRTTVVYHHWEKQEDDWVDFYTVDIDELPRDIRLLREEDSKIYMLLPDDFDINYYPDFLGQNNIATAWNSSDIDNGCKEMILYDFTQRNGDIIQGCIEECIPAGFPVTYTDNITIEGEECIVQHNSEVYWDFMYRLGNYPTYNFYDYKIIEGIGFDGWGTMTMIPVLVTSNEEPNFFINNVYNSEGEVIYPGRGQTVPTKDYNGIDIAQAERLDIRIINGDIFTSGAIHIKIYTLDGQLVYSDNSDGTDAIISTSDWAKGTYIVQAIGVSCNRTIKLTF